jgi:predicted transcriptional regulator
MRYRSRTDITAQILEIANRGANKTKIMYGAYLSYAQLKEYLAVLLENSLIEHIATEQKYKTTEKGLKFLKTINQLSQLTSSMAREIEIV